MFPGIVSFREKIKMVLKQLFLEQKRSTNITLLTYWVIRIYWMYCSIRYTGEEHGLESGDQVLTPFKQQELGKLLNY